MKIVLGTPKQVETLEILQGGLENFDAEMDMDGSVVFEGQGQDGPCLGHVELDGTVSWIVDGGLNV